VVAAVGDGTDVTTLGGCCGRGWWWKKRGLYCPPLILAGIRQNPGNSWNSRGIKFGTGACQIDNTILAECRNNKPCSPSTTIVVHNAHPMSPRQHHHQRLPPPTIINHRPQRPRHAPRPQKQDQNATSPPKNDATTPRQCREGVADRCHIDAGDVATSQTMNNEHCRSSSLIIG
jgi:hypothetical protein